MVLLYSCRNEQLTEQETYNNSSQFRPTSKTISLEESKHKLALKTELQKAQTNLKEVKTNVSGKTIDYANGVSIDTDNVTYIESGPTFHTYTFNLVRENTPENAPLENLVLASLPDGSYKELLVTYNFTPQEKQDLLAGKGVKTKGKATAIELAKGTYGGVISNGMGTVESCSYQTVDMYFSCYTGEHNSDNESEWGGCKWKSEGGYPAQHITTVALVCTATTALGDDGSPGGGDMGPITGLGSGTNEGTPTIPTFTHPKNTPCWKMKVQNQNSDFKAKVAILDKKEMFDKEQETGFAAAYGTVSYEQMPNTPNGNVKLPEGNKYFGFMHVHLNLDGVVKIFSPYDITTFLTSCVENAKLKGGMLDAYAMVITSQGNYILKYSGDGNFAILYDQLQSWQTWYNDNYAQLSENGELNNPASVEKLFTQFLKEIVKVAGLEVYKSDKTTGNTSRLEYDGKDNPVKTTPCP
jgi:hypothetical protein